jgi:hypothetical protein
MRFLSVFLFCAALAVSAFAQTSYSRYPLPTLTGSTNTFLVKSIAGADGVTYSLLNGVDSSGLQVVGVTTTDASGVSTPLTQFTTDLIVDPAAPAPTDFGVDSDGNVYVMYNTPDNNDDIVVSKISPAGAMMWTNHIDGWWKDDKWNIHATHDHGVKLLVNDTFQNVYVAGTTKGDPALGGPFVRIGVISYAGDIVNVRSLQRNDPVLNTAGHEVVAMLALNGLTGANDQIGVVTNTIGDGSDLTIFRFRATNGADVTGRNQVTYQTSYDDWATDAKMIGSFLYVAAQSRVIYTRNGVPYPAANQLLLRFNNTFGRSITYQDANMDSFARPGQYGPSFIAESPEGIYLAAGSRLYQQTPNRINVKLIVPGSSTVMKYLGEPGDVHAAAPDGRGNVFVGGNVILGGTTVQAFEGKVSRTSDGTGLLKTFTIA